MEYVFELLIRIRYLLKFGFVLRFISRIRKYLPIDSTRCWFSPSLPVSLITGTHYFMISHRILLKGFKCYKSVVQDWYLTRKSSSTLLFYWLPIKQRIVFKRLVSTYKELNGLAAKSSKEQTMFRMVTVPSALPRHNC